MTDTMRERIARAALEAYFPRSLFNTDHPEWDKFRLVADAILAAMREPTPQMLIDAGTISGYGEEDAEVAHSDSDHIEWWQAMIDHIRSEGKT